MESEKVPDIQTPFPFQTRRILEVQRLQLYWLAFHLSRTFSGFSSMTQPVQVKKRLLGGHSLAYGCPRCKARLTSLLDDAGKPDTCPDCGARFVVPGVEERDRIRAEQAAVAQRRNEQKQEAAQQRREARSKKLAAQVALVQEQRDRAAERKSNEAPAAAINAAQAGSPIRRCPYCAEEIKAEAKKCKHCGEFLSGDLTNRARVKTERRPWHKPSKAAKYFIYFFLFCVFIAMISDGNRPSETGDAGISGAGELQMIKAAQRGVRRILKAPSSAEFPSPTFNRHAYSIQEISSDTYRVTGYVDAQNSFGAMLRNDWEVICKGDGLDWYAASANLLDP